MTIVIVAPSGKVQHLACRFAYCGQDRDREQIVLFVVQIHGPQDTQFYSPSVVAMPPSFDNHDLCFEQNRWRSDRLAFPYLVE